MTDRQKLYHALAAGFVIMALVYLFGCTTKSLEAGCRDDPPEVKLMDNSNQRDWGRWACS